MEDIRFRCRGCRLKFTLGADALVVTSLGVMADFQAVTVLGTGSSFVDNRADPDLVASLERSWSSLDSSTVRDQLAEMRRISSLLSTGRPRWWKCQKCGTEQTYKLIRVSSKQFEGKTLQEAKTVATNAVPEKSILALDVVRDVEGKAVGGEGKSATGAMEAARARVPSGAFDISPGEIVEEPRHGTLEIQAYSQEKAREVSKREVKRNAPKGASLEEMKCDVRPAKGFLRIGRKRGSWKVQWSTPFRAKVSFKTPAVVVVQFEE